jgi:hypothetical protein
MGCKTITSAAAADDQRSELPAAIPAAAAAGNSDSSNPNSSAAMIAMAPASKVSIQQHSAIAKHQHNDHSRWPREEAMALLRIKSELTDQAAKKMQELQDQADQDPMLWEQISRFDDPFIHCS